MVRKSIWPICNYKQIKDKFGRNTTPVATPKENRPTKSPHLIVLYGAGTKSRTRDLLITNQLLYQLSYAGYLGLSVLPNPCALSVHFQEIDAITS